jgi:hypothetical protein
MAIWSMDCLTNASNVTRIAIFRVSRFSFVSPESYAPEVVTRIVSAKARDVTT